MSSNGRLPGVSFDWIVLVVTFALAGPIVGAYVLDLAGQPLTTRALAIVIVVEAALTVLVFRGYASRSASSSSGRGVGVAVVIAVYLGVVLYFSSPTFVPVSDSADTVHHYALIDYIDRHSSLVHDLTEVDHLGEMAWYPVAACLFVVILHRFSGIPTFYLMAPTCAIVVASIAAFVYGATTELLPKTRRHHLLAVIAFAVLAWPVQYTFGQFWRYFFLTQMVGVLAVIGAWFWQLRYVELRDRALLLPIAGLGAVLVLSYPTLLPIFGVSFVASPLIHPRRPTIDRLIADCVAVGAPLLLLTWFAVHDKLHAGLTILQNNGDTMDPSFDTLPIGFVAFCVAGLAYATVRPERRFATVAFWATLLQTLAFYVAVYGFHQLSPYAAKKMVFVIVPILAAFATAALVSAPEWLARFVRHRARPVLLGTTVLTTAVALVGAGAAWNYEYDGFDPRQDFNLPLTANQYAVAQWMAAHFDSTPIVYFSDRWISVYFADVGILRHSRYPVVPLTALDVTESSYRQWVTSSSTTPYAYMARGVDELVGDEADILFRQGDAAVIRKHPNAVPSKFTQTVGTDMVYRGVHLGGGAYAPGQSLPLTVNVQLLAGASHRDWIQARLYNHQGQMVAHGEAPTVPLDQLKPNPWHRDVDLDIPLTIPIPSATTTGIYTVQVSFFTEFWETLKVASLDGGLDNSVRVGSVTIAPPGTFSASNQPSRPVEVTLGDSIDLVGTDAPQLSADGLAIDLYWRARAALNLDYTVFVQLLNSDGVLVAQSDAYPLNGSYPTSAWIPGQIVQDPHRLKWAPGALEGRFKLIAGMYLAQTMARLPITVPAGSATSNYVVVDTVTLAPTSNVGATGASSP